MELNTTPERRPLRRRSQDVPSVSFPLLLSKEGMHDGGTLNGLRWCPHFVYSQTYSALQHSGTARHVSQHARHDFVGFSARKNPDCLLTTPHHTGIRLFIVRVEYCRALRMSIVRTHHKQLRRHHTVMQNHLNIFLFDIGSGCTAVAKCDCGRGSLEANNKTLTVTGWIKSG